VRVNVSNLGRATLSVVSVTVADKNDVTVPAVKVFITDCLDVDRTGKDVNVMNIAPVGCARFVARFAPRAEGAVVTKILIVSNDPKAPTVTVPVTANGVNKPFGAVKVCVLNVDGTENAAQCSRLADTPPFIPVLDFGTVLFEQPVTRLVRIHNLGTGNLNVTDLHIDPAAGTDFAVKPAPTLPLVIAAGKDSDVPVVVTPQGASNVSAKLYIGSNDTANGKVEVPLLAEEEGPCLNVTPSPTVDFGSIPIGARQPQLIAIENCGHVPYNLSLISFTPDTPGSTVFQIASGDPTGIPALPFAFASGAMRQVQIIYAPNMAQAASSAGDTGTLSLKTDYGGHAAVRVIGHGTSPGCGGMQPVANIQVLNSIGGVVNLSTPQLPLTTVEVDGSSSTTPAGGTITQYTWNLDSAPANNTSTVGSGQKFPFYLELAGDYVISLVVHSSDAYGDMCTSSPATVTIHVVPPPGIHVELTWQEPYGDVDLHYVGPGGALYQQPTDTPQGDLFWAYSQHSYRGTTLLSFTDPFTGLPVSPPPAPDWGLNNMVYPDGNTSNDASLDVDQQWGKGPENVNHSSPFDGDYTVIAQYFCSRQCTQDPLTGTVSCPASSGPATAILKVFVNGVQQWTGRQVITQRDVWEAATVSVRGSSVTVTPTGKALYKIAANGPTGNLQACSSDGN
jgi:hypothetical protein